MIGDHHLMREQDFERLYAAHARPLFGFLAYRTSDVALAEDLLADTFERALRSRSLFDRRKGSEKTWLYAIALNCVRDNARRHSAEERALERVSAGLAPDLPEGGLDRLEQRDTILQALAAMAPEERDAIALRFGADLTIPEIAKLTGEQFTTVQGRVYRALRKLRAELT